MGRCIADKLLSQFLDGELPARAEADVRSHLAACEACRERLEGLRAVDAAVRHDSREADPPDLAGLVTGELKRRGAFLTARVAERRRRLLPGGVLSLRSAAVVGAAIVILAGCLLGFDYASRRDWARQTVPVLADAERIFVRLVYVDPEEQREALARARREMRELDLAGRLLDARRQAAAGMAPDLAYIEEAVALIEQGDELPPDLAREVAGGDLCGRVERLRETLARGF